MTTINVTLFKKRHLNSGKMQNESEKQKNVKNRRLRFSYDDDVSLLREVVAQNPLANPERWEVVQINVERTVRKQFQIRTSKQHLQLLLELFLKKEEAVKIRSGEEEPYSERDALLLEISTISNECGGQKKKRSFCSKEKKISDLGREARERFSHLYANKKIEKPINQNQNENPTEVDTGSNENLIEQETHEIDASEDYFGPQENTIIADEPIASTSTENETQLKSVTKVPSSQVTLNKNTLGPIRRRVNKSRPLRRDAFAYLNEKSDKENRIKMKELELEERKIVIEEKKLQIEERKLILQENNFEIEKMERIQRMELERERLQIELCERKTLNNVLDTQQKIIYSLMK